MGSKANASGRAEADARENQDQSAEAAWASLQWEPLHQERRPRLQRHARWLVAALALAALALIAFYVAAEFRPVPRPAVIASITQGSLEVQLGSDGPVIPAREGQAIFQGARLRSAPDTVALLQLPDQSQVRIESAGEWTLRRLESSPNGEITRIVIGQNIGRASLVPSPVRARLSARFQVEVPRAVIELMGVAHVETSAQATTQVRILQGSAAITAARQRVVMTAGQSASCVPGQPPTLVLEAPRPTAVP